jgi:signal transduction histidine kinase
MKNANVVSRPRPGLLLGAPCLLAEPTDDGGRDTATKENEEYCVGEEVLLCCRVERVDTGGNFQFRVIRQQGRPQPLPSREAAAGRNGAKATGKQPDDLIASLAYDLRTSLNALLGYAQLLEGRIGKDAGHVEQRYLAGIGKAAERLMHSIEIVRQIARLEAGTIELALRRVDLSQLFTQQFERCRQEADSRGIALRLLLATHRFFVLTDHDCLQQAVALLLDHAIAFTKRGSIVVRLYESRDGDVCADISIAGLVLPESLLPSQSPSSEVTNPEYANSSRSLGLSLFTRSLAALSVTVCTRSRKGEGSTFTLSFDGACAFEGPAH